VRIAYRPGRRLASINFIQQQFDFLDLLIDLLHPLGIERLIGLE
jgi:hypothetical protein